jgi:hypothetical protein
LQLRPKGGTMKKNRNFILCQKGTALILTSLLSYPSEI